MRITRADPDELEEKQTALRAVYLDAAMEISL